MSRAIRLRSAASAACALSSEIRRREMPDATSPPAASVAPATSQKNVWLRVNGTRTVIGMVKLRGIPFPVAVRRLDFQREISGRRAGDFQQQ